MLAAPALVAAISGKRSTKVPLAAPQLLELDGIDPPPIDPRLEEERVRRQPIVTPIDYGAVPTLPVRNTRSLGGR